MAQHIQGQFGYRNIQLIKAATLGTGSYGAVYKAVCDDLTCAGKILHPTLFQSNDPGATTIMRRFQQECSFLSAIRHPNIVQYLGSYQDPETRLPVLLMELMDDSLTHFLERFQESLPYHTQVNICHDIALALAYLHSNDILHRDLSSNNVLLIGAGNKAKVTDFGMAKLFSMNCTTMTPLTMCPGTLAYMSPEALDDPPVYTSKLDTFSFGVLVIQIITQQFPNPSPRVKKVRDPRFPIGIQVPVPDTERRKLHIDLINPTHPLRPIAIDCLSYSEEDRPSAQHLCHCLAALKESPLYCDSVQQERSRPAPSTQINSEKQNTELQQEKTQDDQLFQHFQQQLQISGGQIRERDVVISATRQEIWQIQQAGQDKDRVIEAREGQLCELSQQLAASEHETLQLQQTLLQKEKTIQELQEENKYLHKELDKVLGVTQKEKLTLSWKTCKAAPCRMYRGSATVCGSIAYFRPGGTSQVHSYNLDTEEWSTFPECPRERFTLAVIKSLVTAVGGLHSGNPLNTLLSLVEKDGRWIWVDHFPSMPTRRMFTAVACKGKALVVAGGYGKGCTTLATVEVMDTDTLQWSTASSLPHPLSDATATVCGNRVYLLGGVNQRGRTNLVFSCSLNALMPSQTLRPKTLSQAENHTVWYVNADIPVFRSTCVTLKEQLLAFGGQDAHKKDTNSIYSYNTETNSWEIISHMPTSRHWCLVTVFSDNELMVVGGETDTGDTDKVEMATI